MPAGGAECTVYSDYTCRLVDGRVRRLGDARLQEELKWKGGGCIRTYLEGKVNVASGNRIPGKGEVAAEIKREYTAGYRRLGNGGFTREQRTS
jgi:hypothetical protein